MLIRVNLAERLGYRPDDRVLGPPRRRRRQLSCYQRRPLRAPGAEDAPLRNGDYEAFRDRSLAGDLDGIGVKTTTYRQVRDAYRAGALRG
jgi:hypothetical protein